MPWHENGQLVGVTGVTIDITERKRAERAAARLAAIVESSDDAILSYSPEGVIETWNAGAERLCGYAAEEVIGQRREIARSSRVEAAPVRRRAGRRHGEYESRAMRRDGSVLDTSVTMSPIRAADGAIVGVSCVWQDITERKKIERALHENQAMLEAALSSMTDAVFISDAEGRFVHFNEAFTTFHRFNSREETLRSLEDYPAILDVLLANGEPAPLEQWAVPRALRGEIGTSVEYGLRRKDTGERWVGSYCFAPIRSDGAIVGSVVTGRDITAWKNVEAEREARERELARLAQAAEHGTDAIISFDLDSRIVHWSPGAGRLYGFSADEVLGLTLDQVDALTSEPDETTIRGQEAIRKVLAGEPSRQLQFPAPAQGRHDPGHARDAHPVDARRQADRPDERLG